MFSDEEIAYLCGLEMGKIKNYDITQTNWHIISEADKI